METGTVYIVARNGLGQAPEDLQRILAANFFGILAESGGGPESILFYADGVRLACAGSVAIDSLRTLERQGSKLILCRTCLDYFGLTDKVEVGTVGKMTDIIAALQGAVKVVSV